MVRNIFLYRYKLLKVLIVYNESSHNNLKYFEYLFFHRVKKKYHSLKRRQKCMTQHCVVMHTYIYQIGPVIFRLVRSQHNDELYLLGNNTSITNEEVPVLSPITANFIGQLSLILTNNLNLKAPTCDRYMFTHLHFCFSKIGGVF